MEITKMEITKISKKFKIPEKSILDFLEEEERLLQLAFLKQSFLNEPALKTKITIAKEWYTKCKTYTDFEEFYVMADIKKVTNNFFFDWLAASKGYKENRDVYLCALEEDVVMAKKLLKAWNDQAESLEDIREAMSYLEPDSDDYKVGMKKIMKIYKG